MKLLRFPKYISIQTTSLCNASCVFCPHKDIRDVFPDKIMTMDLYRKIIRECSQSNAVKNIILYMNNEPLTDPYLVERIKYAKTVMPDTCLHILTNGALLTEGISQELIDSGIDWIGISFHGIRKDTVEKAMGIPYQQSFERINNFILMAKKKKDIKNYVLVTFLKHVYLDDKEAKDARDYWHQKGIERVCYYNGPISRAGNVKDMTGTYHPDKIAGCNSIWADEMLHIVEDGKVVLCCMDWRREVILADLNNETIKDVWENKRSKAWDMIYGKSHMPKDFICRRCEEAIPDSRTRGVLLVMPPPWGVDSPPLAMACLKASLESKEIPVDIFDMNIDLYNSLPERFFYLWGMNYSHLWRQEEDYLSIRKELGAFIDPLIDKIVNAPQKIIGFSLATNCPDFLIKEIIQKIKQRSPDKVIVLGGVSISIDEQRQALLRGIEGFVDFCVTGEGERAICDISDALLKGNTDFHAGCNGILTRDDFFNTVNKLFASDLNSLPHPSFDGFDLDKYVSPGSLPMEFSRGCIGTCPFCDFKSISPVFKTKSADYIVEEIKLFIERYNTKHISASDAAINSDIRVLEKTCDLLIENDIKINISAMAIPRKEMTPQLLKKMHRAGFLRLEYGVESGSEKILKSMRKIFTPEIAYNVIKDTSKAGIKTCLYLMVGYPDETEQDFISTKEFLRKSAAYITMIKSINPLYIMAGSEMRSCCREYGIALPEHNKDTHWVFKENNIDFRKRRVYELKDYAQSLNIPFTEEAECLKFARKA